MFTKNDQRMDAMPFCEHGIATIRSRAPDYEVYLFQKTLYDVTCSKYRKKLLCRKLGVLGANVHKKIIYGIMPISNI